MWYSVLDINCFTFLLSELDASKSRKRSSRKKKRKKHTDSVQDSIGSTTPPPLRKRMSKSREGDDKETNEEAQESELKQRMKGKR